VALLLDLKDEVCHPASLAVANFDMAVDTDLSNGRGIPPEFHRLNALLDQVYTLLSEKRALAENFQGLPS
jgi:hypothetical protein